MMSKFVLFWGYKGQYLCWLIYLLSLDDGQDGHDLFWGVLGSEYFNIRVYVYYLDILKSVTTLK